jgi:hypothetical protein
MEATDPREPAAALSTSPGATDSELLPHTDRREVDPNARWNWWILNHGLLIGSTLIVLALVTLGLRFLSDHRCERRPSTTSVANQTSQSNAPSLANNLVPVSDAAWARSIDRAKLVSPPEWDQVLASDW